MTLATKLTLLRILLIPVFLVAFIWRGSDDLNQDWGKIIAATVFIVAAITDYYDGAVARWYKEETTLGKFMDPIADKLLVSTALVSMVEYRSITFTPGWIAALIISREFAVTGMRLVFAQKGVVLAADNLAKWKTTAQLTAIITSLVFVSARVVIESWMLQEQALWFLTNHGTIIQILMYIAVILTIWSGYEYFKKNNNLLFE